MTKYICHGCGTIYEVARRNMIAFAEFFHKKETMKKLRKKWEKNKKKRLKYGKRKSNRR